jgi:hypothetical protein
MENNQVTQIEYESPPPTLGTINQDIDTIANKIRHHVNTRKLTVSIQGRDYPMVEAWQYAGALLGLFPRVIDCKDLSTREKKEVEIKKKNYQTGRYEIVKMTIESYKYCAEVEVVDIYNNRVITKAFAWCSNEEKKKHTFDEYAIASMAQTRATGKAFRVLLAWIMQASGYETTPAEEMDGVKDDDMKAEYKIMALKAMDLCKTKDDMKNLMEHAVSIADDQDIRKKGKDIINKINANNNGK